MHDHCFCFFFPDIRIAVKNLKPLDTSRIKFINEKLERCRNQENNPDSQS